MAIDKRFFSNNGPFTLDEIAKVSGSAIYNQNIENILIHDLSPLEDAEKGHISVFNNKKYINSFINSKATACFTTSKDVDIANKDMILLISDNPYKSYALTSALFYPENVNKPIKSSNVYIDNSAILGSNCVIASGVVIGPNVIIGNNCRIGANTVIEQGVLIGNNCDIAPSVTISHAIIGNNIRIKPGTCIGQEGFGFASDKNGHYKVAQLGRVIIKDNVFIGANCCIDRGSGHDTVIEENSMLDNLIQIGHNVEIGKNSILVAQVGVAGSTKIGDFVVAGGQVGFSGHLKIGSGAQIAAQSGVINDIKPGEAYGGYPAQPIRIWHRQTAMIKKLSKNNKEDRHD